MWVGGAESKKINWANDKWEWKVLCYVAEFLTPVEAIFGGIVALSLVFKAYENECGNRGVGAIFVFITIAR